MKMGRFRFHRFGMDGAGEAFSAGADQDAFKVAKAGRSASVIGSVSSTTAATAVSADGTPTASPSKP
jgi:hypothetical protein